MKNRAFTLIEMLGVLAIIAILLSISTIAIKHSQAKARDVVRKSDLQMIADALISYGNDHGHFPSSIYDNVSNGQALTISQALNMISEGGNYISSGDDLLFYPYTDIIENILGKSINQLLDEHPEFFDSKSAGEAGINSNTYTTIYTLKNDIKLPTEYDSLKSIINNAQDNIPVITDDKISNFLYSIITQGMCAGFLKKYLVNEGYISTIPGDPSGESINLKTNICVDPSTTFEHGFNANDTLRSINTSIEGECYASTNLGCTQICKEGYVYVSDGEHFALIAHMESKNGGNYETTSCGLSCEIAGSCSHTNQNDKEIRTKTDQLPCDITDEFTNSFDCIQNTGVVEYNTGEYYFYIY